MGFLALRGARLAPTGGAIGAAGAQQKAPRKTGALHYIGLQIRAA